MSALREMWERFDRGGLNPSKLDGGTFTAGCPSCRAADVTVKSTAGQITIACPSLCSDIEKRLGTAPRAHRDASELTGLTIPAEFLEQAGVSEEDLEGVDSVKDLLKVLGKVKNTVATKIVELVEQADFALFHDTEQNPYATFDIDGHAETWPLKSGTFKQYLRRLYYTEYEAAANGQAVTDALGVLAAKATFDGDEVPVHYRVAGDANAIYLDLGDADWRAVQITREGWTVLDRHPVRFWRTGAMAALPIPKPGGELNLLRPFVNVANEDDWRLVVGWLLASARPGFPYPILVEHGEQGSAKSTTTKVLRSLIDPNRSPLRVAPHDIDDLMVSARVSWIVAYDNISKIPPSLSDALCRLSTGGGLSKRELYTDSDEVLLDAMRPVILNGIEESANRSDLLDRAVIVEMPVIGEDQRQPEEEFWRAFEASRPAIFGGLCDALAGALARVGSVQLDRLPRMADFARWVTAAEPTLKWEPGAFISSYTSNRGEVHELAVEGSPIGSTLVLIADRGFEGTASDLLAQLKQIAGRDAEQKEWPKSARALSGEVARLAPNLRQLGYDVQHWREPSSDRRRMIAIRRSA